MEPEGVLTSGDQVVGRYNLRGRSVEIRPWVSGRFGAMTKARARAKNATKTARVTRGTGTSRAASEKDTNSKLDEKPRGIPFPRWKLPGYEIDDPLRSGDKVVGWYNLRGRSVEIRPWVSVQFSAMAKARARARARARAKKATKTAPVTCKTGTSRAAAEEKNTSSKLDEKPRGTPFPRWKLPGYKIEYPFKTDGDCSVWPFSKEHQRAIMERTVLPFVPLALQHYMSNNLCDQDDLEFVRMVDICAIHFYGTVFNLKFEAKHVGSVDHESSRVFFAQVHFGEDPIEKGHISRCCLYDPNMSDVPYIHADCLVCFPDPSDGYQHNAEAGKCATAVFNRVVRVRRKLPADHLFRGCYFLTEQETLELLRYHSVGLAKLALDDFKTKTTNDEDAGLEFLGVVKVRLFDPPHQMINIKFKVKRGNSVDTSPKLFSAQVHMISELYDVGVDAHVSVCHPYDPNDPGFPPNCAVCYPRLSRGKRVKAL